MMTRSGTASTLTTALGNPSTLGYPAGAISWGDNSRELHWVGELQVGDVVTMQYLVQSDGTATDTFALASNRNGGHRLSTVFLRG